MTETDREELIASLTASVVAAQPRAVLLHGEAGIGKTWLIRAVRDRLEESGWSAPLVTGSTAGSEVPLGGFWSLPGLSPRPHPSDVIEHLAAQRAGLVLLVDGVERLDPASQFVVAHLARDAGLRILLTARDLASLPPTLLELYDAGDAAGVPVAPLADAACLALATELLGDRLTPAAGATLLPRASGNPLLLRELLLGSQDAGALQPTDHGWEFVDDPVASGRVADLVGLRLDHLSPDARRLARVLAAGGELPEKVVGVRALEELRRADVVHIDHATYADVSSLVYADVLREQCPAGQWRDVLREAARLAHDASLVVDPPRDAELARRATALRLEAGDDVPVEEAVALAAHGHALLQHTLVLRLADAALAQDPGHPEARRLRGLAASALGDVDAAARDLCPRPDDPPTTRLRHARALAHHLGTRGRDARAAAEVLTTSLAPEVAPDERAAAERDLVRWHYTGALRDVLTPPEPGAAAAHDRADDRAGQVHALVTAGMAGCLTGPLDDARVNLGRARELMVDPFPEWPAAPDLLRVGELMAMSYDADVVATRERGQRELERDLRDRPDLVGTWQFSLGVLELFAADPGDAHAYATEAASNLGWRDPVGLAPAGLALAHATATAVGLAPEADRYLRELPETALTDPKVAMLVGWAEARRLWSSGQRRAAAEALLAGASDLYQWRHVFFAGMVAHCAARAGAPESALDVLGPAARDAGGGLIPLLRDHAAAIRDGDRASLTDITVRLAGLGNTGSAADSAMALAGMWSEAGREIEARRWEMWSREQLADGGAVTWGERPPADDLTARELEVARLAASRLSAKEIAATLGTSPNTVTNQLASIYRKLGVRGRAELAERFEVVARD